MESVVEKFKVVKKMDVQGKIVVVTGGASGIGLSCVEQLLLHNVKFVAIFDLSSPTAETAVTKLKNQFGEGLIQFFSCDVTNKHQVEKSFDKVMEMFGSFDILINSAGILNEEKWNTMVNVNVCGTMQTSFVAINLIGKHKGGKGGTIVNIASMAGITPVHFLATYCATKYAVVGFTTSLKLNYNKTGVRMLLMCPGLTTTPLTTNIFDNLSLSFVDRELSIPETQFVQLPEMVAKGLVQLIERGVNGAACVVDEGKSYLVDIPTIESLELRKF